MENPSILAFGRLFLLLLLLRQQHVQATNGAQLKSQPHHHHQQHQQQQQHHQQQQAALGQNPHVQQQHSPHPISSSSNGVHQLAGGLSTQALTPSSSHPSTSSANPSSSSSSSSSAAASTSNSPSNSMPPAQFVNDKDAAAVAAVQEVLKHFQADDDLGDPYQLLNELKREANAVSGLSTQATMPPPQAASATLSGPSSNYPWNLFERSPYGTQPYNAVPLPPLPPMAGLLPHLFSPYDGYPSSFPLTPRFMPFMSYPQPILVTYPFYMSPEMFYPGFSPLANEYEDSMSRVANGAGRRPSPGSHSTTSYSRNSPIYYVRLPPTPYMFLPSLGLGATPTAMAGFPAMLPYQSLPSFPSFSSIYNVPINFLANGKPNNIYQMGGSPNDLQSPLSFANIPTNYENRPAPHSHHSVNNAGSVGGSYRPTSSTHNYFNAPPISSSSQNYGSTYPSAGSSSATSSSTTSTSTQSLQDSKLTSLKRPYFFNGRPEDIYILPNNFNSLYSAENSYY